MDVLKDMLFRQLQFLEQVLAEIPEEQLKTTYSVMVQERIVELFGILFESDKHSSNLTNVVEDITRQVEELDDDDKPIHTCEDCNKKGLTFHQGTVICTGFFCNTCAVKHI